MSKSGKTKYRWNDEEEDFSRDKKARQKDSDRRKEKRMKNAIRGKNFDYFISDDEY